MRLGRGSLYNEFGDKHALFLQALDRYCAERLAELTQILESTPSVHAGIAAVLRSGAFRSALERGVRNTELDPSLDVLATARYLANTLNSLRLLVKMTDREAAEDVVQLTLDVLI